MLFILLSLPHAFDCKTVIAKQFNKFKSTTDSAMNAYIK